MAESASGEGAVPTVPVDAQSARTFALVGFIFYLILTFIWAIVVTAGALTFLFLPSPPVPGIGRFFALALPAILLGATVGLTLWAWMVLRDIEAGRFQKAQSPSLVLGILGLFPPLGGLLGGIFFILAYAKVGDSIAYPQGVRPAAAPTPAGGRICPNCGRPIPMDAQFCPYCGEKLP